MHTSTFPSHTEETSRDSKWGRRRCIITLLKRIIEKGLSVYGVSRCAESHRANYKCPFELLHENPKCREKAYLLFLRKCYVVASFLCRDSACVCPSVHGPVTLKMRCCQAHLWHTAILRNKRAIVQLTHATPACHRQSVHPSVFCQPQWTVCKRQYCTLDGLPVHCRGHRPFIHT